MYRDSFGNALLPFVADEYNHGYFSKAVPYNINLADDYNADAVVIEITERHIPSLIEEVPYMAAPLRTENLSVQTTDKCKSVIEMVDSENQYLPFKGAVDKNYLSDDGNIYVRMYNDKILILLRHSRHPMKMKKQMDTILDFILTRQKLRQEVMMWK